MKNEYYRKVRNGEILLKGDVYVSRNHKDKLQPICYDSGRPHNGINDVLRPVTLDEWIPVSERLPEAEDRDKRGCVQWYERGASYCTDYLPNPIGATHWRRITPPEKLEPEIKIAGNAVEFLPDGSVKVGCTTVPKETFKAVKEAWEAKQKAAE